MPGASQLYQFLHPPSITIDCEKLARGRGGRDSILDGLFVAGGRLFCMRNEILEMEGGSADLTSVSGVVHTPRPAPIELRRLCSYSPTPFRLFGWENREVTKCLRWLPNCCLIHIKPKSIRMRNRGTRKGAVR